MKTVLPAGRVVVLEPQVPDYNDADVTIVERSPLEPLARHDNHVVSRAARLT